MQLFTNLSRQSCLYLHKKNISGMWMIYLTSDISGHIRSFLLIQDSQTSTKRNVAKLKNLK